MTQKYSGICHSSSIKDHPNLSSHASHRCSTLVHTQTSQLWVPARGLEHPVHRVTCLLLPGKGGRSKEPQAGGVIPVPGPQHQNKTREPFLDPDGEQDPGSPQEGAGDGRGRFKDGEVRHPQGAQEGWGEPSSRHLTGDGEASGPGLALVQVTISVHSAPSLAGGWAGPYLMELSGATSRSASSVSLGGGSLGGTAEKAGDFLEKKAELSTLGPVGNMACGGCGRKVGAKAVYTRGSKGLRSPVHPGQCETLCGMRITLPGFISL